MKNYNDYIYPDVFRAYNSERREQSGVSSILKQDTFEHTVFNMPAGSVQTFLLDGDNTDSSNTKTVTLYTYANGVKQDLTYYATDNGNYITVSIVSQKFYRDNNIAYEYVFPTPRNFNVTKQNGSTLSSIRVPYAINHIDYGRNEQLGDYGVMHMGGCIFAENFLDSPPYGWPTLSGEQDFGPSIPTSQYGRAYSIVSLLPDAQDDDTYQSFFDKIIEAGDGTPISPILPSEDPSEPGGGDDADPDYNPFSDPVDFPGLPTGGTAIDSGFIRVYNPTSTQLRNLANKLWAHDFVSTIEKIMNDPMEAMISLHSVPFQIVGGANANIEVGNYDTEISAATVTTQYYTLDCGNISVPEHWASALDYSPYTNVDIFIPFVGVRPLQIDDVMKRVLNLKYNIDILTGSAIAMLKCGDSVLYTYNTQIQSEIPYTMSSFGRLLQSIVGVAGTAIGATAGGAGAIIGGGIGGALGTAMTKHSDISRGGALGGTVGVMGDFTPYLIIHRPLQSLASGFANKKGYPSNIGATLGSVSGYTVVDKVHLTGIDCTDTERDEIHALLKDGVII